MRPLETLRAALGDLVYPVQDKELVDALQTDNTVFNGHADDSSIGVYISGKEGRQDVFEARRLRFAALKGYANAITNGAAP